MPAAGHIGLPLTSSVFDSSSVPCAPRDVSIRTRDLGRYFREYQNGLCPVSPATSAAPALSGRGAKPKFRIKLKQICNKCTGHLQIIPSEPSGFSMILRGNAYSHPFGSACLDLQGAV